MMWSSKCIINIYCGYLWEANIQNYSLVFADGFIFNIKGNNLKKCPYLV